MSESVDAFVGLFPNHAIVRLEGDKGWAARDANNRLTVLDGKDALLKLIDSDPPRATGDLELVKRYALFVDEIENPDDKRIDSFQSIVWKEGLTPEEQQRINTARGRHSVAAPVVAQRPDHISVVLWVTSQRRLIYRIIKVKPNGHFTCDNSVWDDELPLVATTAKKYSSLDAFRSFFGVPTMPIEQCRLCSVIPERTSRHVADDDVEDDRPGEMLELEMFLDGGRECEILRCPTCNRLYAHRTSFGVGYFDYDSSWRRYDVDALFNIEWCVKQRLPTHRVKSVKNGDSPDLVMVQLEGVEGWSVLDSNNQLTTSEPKQAPVPKPVEAPPPASLPIVVEKQNIFRSFDSFRAHCGEPTMPLEQCTICSKIPWRCRKGDDHIPGEIAQLVDFIESDVRRCPTCHRLYLYESMHFGNDIYEGNDSTWSLTRLDVDVLFDMDWCVKQRLPNLDVTWVWRDHFFPHHALVRIEKTWNALDHANELTVLGSRDAIVKLIERDPPRDPAWTYTVDLAYNTDVARRYALALDEIENPDDLRFEPGHFASRVEDPVYRTWDRRVIVRFWVRSRNRKFLRIMTVQPDGHYERREAAAPSKMFESLDAFRAHCGEPTMPLEQCQICSKTPEHDHGESACEPPEATQFAPFIESGCRRCATCHRLYLYDSFSGGNDIYRGNETTYSLDRYTTDALFDSEWGVRHRLPDLDVSWVGEDRFFPNHVLVRFGSRAWGALDRNNQLVVLDSRYALEEVIGRDPSHVTADLELAKRYALFVDEREFPEDDRPEWFESIRWRAQWSAEERLRVDAAKAATGLPVATEPAGRHDMRAVAERDGDRVVVRFWAVPQTKQLIRRVLTVQPNGQVIREDSVIAENLPIRDGLPFY